MGLGFSRGSRNRCFIVGLLWIDRVTLSQVGASDGCVAESFGEKFLKFLGPILVSLM